VEEIKKMGVRNLRGNEWEIKGDLVLKEGKVYVLKDKKLRIEIIWLYHDIPVVEHEERWKTMELVTRNYWWPEMMKNVEKYVDEYNLCQRIKNRTEAPARKLIINEVPEKMWTHLIVDFITKPLLVTGKNMILVVCNQLSKMAHFVATTEETSAEGLARLLRTNV